MSEDECATLEGYLPLGWYWVKLVMLEEYEPLQLTDKGWLATGVEVPIVISLIQDIGDPINLPQKYADNHQKKLANSLSDQELYSAAILRWGEDDQIKMTMGECGELIAALNSHFNQNKKPIECVIDELADVEIMCAQMRLIVGSDKVTNRKAFKLERLKKILAGEIDHPHV